MDINRLNLVFSSCREGHECGGIHKATVGDVFKKTRQNERSRQNDERCERFKNKILLECGRIFQQIFDIKFFRSL